MKDFLNFEAIARWEGDIAYAANMDYNALFEVDMVTGNCKYIRMFNEKCDKKRLFTTAYKVGEKIYFVPASADRIAVYKPEDNYLYEIEIDSVNLSDYKFYKKNAKFNAGIVKNKFLYLTPCTYPAIIRINTTNDEMDYFSGYFSGDFMFRKAPYLDETIIYLPDTKSNRVLKFDVDSCKGNLVKIPTKHFGWWSMCKIQEKFWLSPKESGPIICWDEKNNTVVEYGKYPADYEKSDFLSSLIFEHDNCPFILPANSNMGLSVDVEKNTIIQWKIDGVSKGSEVALLYIDGNNIGVRITLNGKVAYKLINKCDFKIKNFEFKFVDNREKYYEDYSKVIKGAVIREGFQMGLEDFLNIVENYE